MDFICLHSKEEIESFLRKDLFLNIYCIGDLDDFFWSHTLWFAKKHNKKLEAIAMLYTGAEIPTLLALSSNIKLMASLLEAIMPILPSRFYTHLSPTLETFFYNTYAMTPHGNHLKMALKNEIPLFTDCPNCVKLLSVNDIDEIKTLYAESYPGNWFDKRMLDTNQYFGLWKDNVLTSIAGIHVYSKKYKVAALGNITTHPLHRGKGYGKLVTSKLCKSLVNQGIQVGLNVKSDNQNAISCYRKIGFETIGSYNEFLATKKS